MSRLTHNQALWIETNRCKITIIENTSSHIKNYTQLFESDLDLRIVASQGQIHKKVKKIEIRVFFLFLGEKVGKD